MVLRCDFMQKEAEIKHFCDVLPAFSMPGNVEFRPHKGQVSPGTPGG
jgi:hypothetical protein